jgi:hypothetical protein
MITRRTATKIKDGSVQKKNRHTKTPNYWNTHYDDIQIDAEKPGKGYKHFLKKRDIKMFLNILPNHEEIDPDFDAVLLSQGSYYNDGWYKNGVVAINAWEKDLCRNCSMDYFKDHKEIFDKLEVKYDIKKDHVICDFTENQIKAYQLLHVFLHEVGHHHDCVHTKSRKCCSKGEKYAEDYALKYEKIIWEKYFENFPI